VSSLSELPPLASRVLSTLMLQPVGPKAGTPGTAAPPPDAAATSSAQQAQPQSTWILLAPMLVVVVFMLFTSRNQKKREAETREKLKKGDRVVSQSGLIGELIDMEGNVAKVKIAPGTNVQMLIGSISPYDTKAAGNVGADKSLKDLKDAKAAAEKKG
jgi:preprotein translocase subunit YajC